MLGMQALAVEGDSSSQDPHRSRFLLSPVLEGVAPPSSQLSNTPTKLQSWVPSPLPGQGLCGEGGGALAGAVRGLCGGVGAGQPAHLGYFQGLVHPATRRLTLWPLRRPTGQGPGTHRSGRRGCRSWTREGRGPQGEDSAPAGTGQLSQLASLWLPTAQGTRGP